ncbi:hypothetical protein MTsPCn5_21890 [Croceitalea sp. MTPC5]|uniref:DUF3575 domain-containing protein n=1 Tax=Croceitalea sp. MTPC5 TaxID=3056565 RepID=UPI002B365424|nr:hypothetical protein MTsPCn5_21890 [Croceitalea sp. MTPC5]
MKKIVLLILLVIPGITILAQSSDQSTTLDEKKDEIRIDAIGLIAFKYIDLTYENLLNEESGLGINLQFTLDGDQSENVNRIRRFSLTPFYRQYFSRKYAKGFFVEGFMMYAANREYDYVDFIQDPVTGEFMDVYENIDFNTLAIGVSVGGKFVTKRGFVAEVFLGIGRNLLEVPENSFISEIEVRGGIALGYRF